MNTIKLITIVAVLIASITILTLGIYLFFKPYKVIKTEENNLKISYGIWLSSVIISGGIIISTLLKSVFEAVDVIQRMNQENLIIQISKLAGSLLFVSMSWLFLWYFLTKSIGKIFYKTSLSESLENDNTGYFLIQGSVLVSLIFCSSAILEILLKMLIPSIDIPFYH